MRNVRALSACSRWRVLQTHYYLGGSTLRQLRHRSYSYLWLTLACPLYPVCQAEKFVSMFPECSIKVGKKKFTFFTRNKILSEEKLLVHWLRLTTAVYCSIAFHILFQWQLHFVAFHCFKKNLWPNAEHTSLSPATNKFVLLLF
jgi:hypothetical protein